MEIATVTLLFWPRISRFLLLISKLAYEICQIVCQNFIYCITDYTWVKYKAITNNTLFDDSLPLDDKMELRELGFPAMKKSNILLFP